MEKLVHGSEKTAVQPLPPSHSKKLEPYVELIFCPGLWKQATVDIMESTIMENERIHLISSPSLVPPPTNGQEFIVSGIGV